MKFIQLQNIQSNFLKCVKKISHKTENSIKDTIEVIKFVKSIN